ncbi:MULTISPECIES: Fe-S cluster assembly sulfur transfer protein SufU [Selenomonas]|uniref:Fe-S cluster assembly sulfur transfer protein SufU n=1 Tax=Selenomonas TaxID=970 RepID=UPI0001E09793|nr:MULTISPECIES: SUF system NifU family Fe-S cluster assembly protein [Selenomonas]EFM23935.1 SUF system FeS assembly protein, NifU family [Selenomonas sp. oral taxon 149 str. 67H29BP]MBF1694252.1 SUF system NifU family Fe-S cluster assembly protein [Selenomonas sp.]
MPTENTALGDLYTEVIGEHSRSPENKGELAAATVRERGHNPSCGDEITLELQIENGIIKDAAFTGVGCAISQASTDIMIDLMRGKTVEEAQRLAQLFTSMIKREVTDDAALEELDEAIALKNISNMPARVKCAVLAWHTLEDVLKKDQ